MCGPRGRDCIQSIPAAPAEFTKVKSNSGIGKKRIQQTTQSHQKKKEKELKKKEKNPFVGGELKPESATLGLYYRVTFLAS